MDSFSAPGVEISAVHGTEHDKSSTPQETGGIDGIEAEATQGTSTEPGQTKRRKLTSEVSTKYLLFV